MRVLIVGFGWWGTHVATRLKGHAWIRIAGVVEPDQARHGEIGALGCAAYTDYSRAVDSADFDVILLTTPTGLHEEQVLQAAAAGKSVFCEKPLTLSAAGARRMIAACERAGVALGIGHERRFEPAIVGLKADLEARTLGTVMHAEAAFSHDKLSGVAPGNWRTSRTLSPAAGMTAMGIHLTDLYIYLFGRVRSVQALVTNRVLGWETGDVVSIQLAFEAGMTATLSVVLMTPHFMRVHVFGSDRWVQVINESHPDTPGGVTRRQMAASGQDMIETEFPWMDAVLTNLEAFCNAARGGQPYPVPTWQMLHNIEVLEAIIASAESQQTVRLS